MATQYLHPDVYDDGLKVISENAGMSIVVTAGAPASRAEALDPVGTGTGKRVSDVIALPASDATLGAATGGRKVAIASKTGEVAVGTAGSENLHLAIYDGTRLLAVTDETSDQQLTLGNPITLPTFDITLTTQQPV